MTAARKVSDASLTPAGPGGRKAKYDGTVDLYGHASAAELRFVQYVLGGPLDKILLARDFVNWAGALQTRLGGASWGASRLYLSTGIRQLGTDYQVNWEYFWSPLRRVDITERNGCLYFRDWPARGRPAGLAWPAGPAWRPALVCEALVEGALRASKAWK